MILLRIYCHGELAWAKVTTRGRVWCCCCGARLLGLEKTWLA